MALVKQFLLLYFYSGRCLIYIFFLYINVVSTRISSNAWMVEKGQNDQPASKSKTEVVEEAQSRGGFEMFWDVFDEVIN